MVQFALDSFLSALRDLSGLLVPLGIVLGGFLVTLLVLAILDRERPRRWLDHAGPTLRRLGGWLLVALSLFLGVVALRVTRHAVDARISTLQNARASTEADPSGGETVQPAPTATYISERTYTRTLTLPPQFLDRLGEDGVGALTPYLTDPSSESIERLVDTFRRSGRDVVFTREATLLVEDPIRFDTSNVNVDLAFVDPLQGGRQTYYNARFEGRYAFRNPLQEPASVRFVFPLPYGSGTLSNFELLADGQPVQITNLDRGAVWEGTVAAGASVSLVVRYRNQGARAWSYQLAARREPIANFDLTVKADRAAKFARFSLFPTSTASSFAGPSTLRWQLKDVITAQNVSLTFSGASLRETLAKVFAFAPAALLVGAAFVLAWAWRRGLSLSPVASGLTVLGFTLGFVLAGVLTAYMNVIVAGLLGAALAVGLGVVVLGRRFLVPLVLTAAAPLAFLATGHAGLLLTVLGALAFSTLLPRPRSTTPRG
ncbi:hypothetical protein [Deinococcus yavapaiensis]|uniref:Inner membrane protein n=1 Tax=Deinococcus yavapaiensis KR-236 TaxID=694435 RepID=A0A318S6V3_9DEIO|nr:hypothetical protein [Deinococcus yavapaiensis]PYE53369.1 hypothetical protein DES52_109146 [Deinococcus yavapaiensis KR-236]